MQEYQISITDNKEDIYYEPMCHFDFGDSITATDDFMHLPRLDKPITEPSVFEAHITSLTYKDASVSLPIQIDNADGNSKG